MINIFWKILSGLPSNCLDPELKEAMELINFGFMGSKLHLEMRQTLSLILKAVITTAAGK